MLLQLTGAYSLPSPSWHHGRLGASTTALCAPRLHQSRQWTRCTQCPRQTLARPVQALSQARRLADEFSSSDDEDFEDNVELIADDQELEVHLKQAGKKQLVVLEVQGVSVCESGYAEPELQWKLDQQAEHDRRMDACRRVRNTYHRVAQGCPDVKFLEIMVQDGSSEGEALKNRLGVSVLPTIQFFRDNKLLWQQEGFVGMEDELGAGLLYYRDADKAREYVTDLQSNQDLEKFIQHPNKDMLVVVAVTTELCSPCIKVYPAVLALARNFVGHVVFGRLQGDQNPACLSIMRELGILEVPTFIFYRGGKELGRLVGSSKGDLIGNILTYQQAAGLKLPPPQRSPVGVARRQPATARARRDPWK